MALQVRSIDEEEEGDESDSMDGGRVIEAFTEPIQDPDSSAQQPPQHEQPTNNEISSAHDAAEQDAEKEVDDRTVWQRLRGMKRGGGAKTGDGRAGQNGVDRGGRLSARRILERSTSKKGGTGGTDPFAEMLGLGSGELHPFDSPQRSWMVILKSGG